MGLDEREIRHAFLEPASSMVGINGTTNVSHAVMSRQLQRRHPRQQSQRHH